MNSFKYNEQVRMEMDMEQKQELNFCLNSRYVK